MITDQLHIMPTDKSPDVLLDPEGIIMIKGRAIDENISIVPKQIVEWIDSYLLNPADSTEVTIALEYLNSYNTMILTSALRKLLQVKQQSKDLNIKWYIEDDDDDLLDRSQSISSALNIPINIIRTDNIKSWY
jgi:hypothetical protein